MSLGLELILTTTLAATPPDCSWAHSGANPYRGDPARALADFELPAATRDRLRELMRTHRLTDSAVITREAIVGDHGAYTDLRQMHSGHGRVCRGAVDRSAWSAGRQERAAVYCVDDACVIVPAICHNVALVTREPQHVADDEGPIDLEPAAGPPEHGRAAGSAAGGGRPAGLSLPARGRWGHDGHAGWQRCIASDRRTAAGRRWRLAALRSAAWRQWRRAVLRHRTGHSGAARITGRPRRLGHAAHRHAGARGPRVDASVRRPRGAAALASTQCPAPVSDADKSRVARPGPAPTMAPTPHAPARRGKAR